MNHLFCIYLSMSQTPISFVFDFLVFRCGERQERGETLPNRHSSFSHLCSEDLTHFILNFLHQKVSMPSSILLYCLLHQLFIFYFISLLLFDSLQAPLDECVGKDWRSIDFRQNHAIHLKKDSYCVFMCQRANRGECQYAVCHVCHEEQSKTQKRTRGGVLSADDLMETCHHELCHLQVVYQGLFGW